MCAIRSQNEARCLGYCWTYLPRAHLQSGWSGLPGHWRSCSCRPPPRLGEGAHHWWWPARGVIHWPNSGDSHFLPEAGVDHSETRWNWKVYHWLPDCSPARGANLAPTLHGWAQPHNSAQLKPASLCGTKKEKFVTHLLYLQQVISTLPKRREWIEWRKVVKAQRDMYCTSAARHKVWVREGRSERLMSWCEMRTRVLRKQPHNASLLII